ncbi:peroxide stress protein YaaA, partial [Clostridioides difficile]
ANSCIRIISGLYGVVKPYDSIYEYRLEMQTKLRVGEFKNLYECPFVAREVAELGINLYITGFTKPLKHFEPVLEFHQIAKDNLIN